MKRFAATAISLLLLTGCSGGNQTVDSSQTPTMAPVDIDVSDVKLPDDGIIYINQYQNWAEGYQDYGSFICTDGKVFTFDFSTYSYGRENDDEIYSADNMTKFELIRRNAEPVNILEPERVKAIYSEGIQISPQETFRTENVACDAGSHTVTFCDPAKGTQVCLSEYGDYEGELKNKHADKISELTENIIPPEHQFSSYTKLTSLDGLISDRGVSKHSDCEGTYLLLNCDQLTELAKQSGCPIDGILSSKRDEVSDCVFYVTIKNLSAGDSSPIPKCIICDRDRIGIAYDGEEKVGSDCCTWTIFCGHQYTHLTSPDLTDLSGEPFIIPDYYNVNADPLYFCGSSDFISYDLCLKVYAQYEFGYYNGFCLHSQEEYDEFISFCDETGLLGGRSVGDLITSKGTPDFSKGILCITIPYTTSTSSTEWGNTLISDNVITLGTVWNREGYIGYADRMYRLNFAFIPDEYVPVTDTLIII